MASRRTRNLLQPGARAPEFRLPRLDGSPAAGDSEATLHDLISGGDALLAFFKITCPVCQFTFPFLERLHQGGLPAIGIAQNDAEDTPDFNREFGLTFSTLLDPEDNDFPVSNAFGISTVPPLFLVQPDGVIARVQGGWSRRDIEWLGGKAG